MVKGIESKLVGGGAGFGDGTGMEIPYLTDDEDLGEQLFGDKESEYAGLADESTNTDNNSNSSTSSSSSSIPATLNNFAYFSQADPRWNNEK